MAYIWLCHKDKLYVQVNALKTPTKMSQHMKNLGFVYLLYKRKDLTLDVLDTNRDWNRVWTILLYGTKLTSIF